MSFDDDRVSYSWMYVQCDRRMVGELREERVGDTENKHFSEELNIIFKTWTKDEVGHFG